MAERSGWKRIAFMAALGLAALVIGAWFGMAQFRAQTASGEASISDLSLPDILDQQQEGSQWLGKVVVVNHWATWCPPCIKEIPLLIETQTALGERGLQIVGVAHDTREAARVFGDQMGINYPSLVVASGGGELLKAQGNDQVSALPYTAFFDREGKLAANKLGLLKPEELNGILESLL